MVPDRLVARATNGLPDRHQARDKSLQKNMQVPFERPTSGNLKKMRQLFFPIHNFDIFKSTSTKTPIPTRIWVNLQHLQQENLTAKFLFTNLIFLKFFYLDLVIFFSFNLTLIDPSLDCSTLVEFVQKCFRHFKFVLMSTRRQMFEVTVALFVWGL